MSTFDVVTFGSREGEPISILPQLANRHGIVTGATGTGKTVTIQTICEGFSRIGVPVFLADVKGDAAGLSQPGGGNARVDERLVELDLPPLEPKGSPVVFWDIAGRLGHPARCTISQMGPALLARLLDLNDTQTGVVEVAFAWADDEGIPVVDLKDLRALLMEVTARRKELAVRYGSISPNSVAAIQRSLLRLEQAGGDLLFGEPSLDMTDLLRTREDGTGYLSILAAQELIHTPLAYSTFLLWLLSELYETLPEVGDPENPTLVFVFDEAHLLFEGVPKSLSEKIEQVMRLIRSKGVGVYFSTQLPTDVPGVVLGQLAHRIQHALRAYTPKDQRAIRAVADTFRENPDIDVATEVLELGLGEALVSVLDASGAPSPVERVMVIPPASRLGPITEEERLSVMSLSPVLGKYDAMIDRESAYEMLQKKLEEAAQTNITGGQVNTPESSAPARKPSQRSTGDDLADLAQDAVSSFGREVGRQFARGILGSLKR